MRLPDAAKLPHEPDTPYARALARFLTDLLQVICAKVNAMASGRLAGTDLTATAMPTTGMYAQGDFVRNSTPVEAGAATAKYVITGWICVAGGTPGTFKESRVLTGN
jgi:hypothetical protein